MSQVANAYPDKGIYFTECSGGNWATDFGSNLEWNIENLIIGAPRNHAKTVLFWNLALDENYGPKNGGCQDCRGVVTVNSVTKNVDRNIEYFVLGHTSKFLKLNAELIETADTRSQGISNVAYLNTDGSKVLLAYNHLSTVKKVQVIVAEKYFNYSIQPGELVTFVW
jgi:glucosylceramidase